MLRSLDSISMINSTQKLFLNHKLIKLKTIKLKFKNRSLSYTLWKIAMKDRESQLKVTKALLKCENIGVARRIKRMIEIMKQTSFFVKNAQMVFRKRFNNINQILMKKN